MPAMSLPAAGGSNRYGTNHCYGAHLARRSRRDPVPGPGDVGNDRHNAWIFDFDRGETGHGYALHEALAVADTRADVGHPDRMNVRHRPPTTDAIGAAVRPYRTTSKPT
jgi:hypothetical protein